MSRGSTPPDKATRQASRALAAIIGLALLPVLLRAHRRHLKTAILYASGYGAKHVEDVVVGPQAPLLEKPYSLEQLAAKARGVLGARANRGDGATPA